MQDDKIIIFEGMHGSHLYGTNIATSDRDIKGVYVTTSLYNYMDRRGSFNTLSIKKEADVLEEYEYFYIQRFAQLLTDQQSGIISMLFCPEHQTLVSSSSWKQLLANRDKLLSRELSSYVYYCKNQASKYTIKGHNLQTLKDFLKEIEIFISVYGSSFILTKDLWSDLCSRYKNREGFEIWNNKTGEELIRICSKSFSRTTELRFWINPLQSLLSKYGSRAEASNSSGFDNKAMMHAFRICREATELLTTGELRYPSKHCPFYLSIRNNELDYIYLQDLLESDIEEMKQAMSDSKLPDKSDSKWISDWAISTQQSYWGI